MEQALPDSALGRMYHCIKNPNSTLDNMLHVQSLNPVLLEVHVGLYFQLMKGRSDVSLAEQEMVAVHVSMLNKCGY